MIPLPFNALQFLDLAKQLNSDNSYDNLDDARIRTVIGRAYYSVFLILRDRFLEEFKDLATRGGSHRFISIYAMYDTILRQKRGVHLLIKKILLGVDVYIGNLFGSLQQLRKDADYEINNTLSSSLAGQSLDIADEILNNLNGLLSKIKHNQKSIYNAIMRQYSRVHSHP